jgi:hypothetical protein
MPVVALAGAGKQSWTGQAGKSLTLRAIISRGSNEDK